MTIVLKRGDRLPAVEAQLLDAAGGAVDLTGATVRFHVADPKGPVVINQPATIVTPAEGRVKYAWASGETDALRGAYYWEFEVTLSGMTLSVPNGGHGVLVVEGDLA